MVKAFLDNGRSSEQHERRLNHTQPLDGYELELLVEAKRRQCRKGVSGGYCGKGFSQDNSGLTGLDTPCRRRKASRLESVFHFAIVRHGISAAIAVFAHTGVAKWVPRPQSTQLS